MRCWRLWIRKAQKADLLCGLSLGKLTLQAVQILLLNTIFLTVLMVTILETNFPMTQLNNPMLHMTSLWVPPKWLLTFRDTTVSFLNPTLTMWQLDNRNWKAESAETRLWNKILLKTIKLSCQVTRDTSPCRLSTTRVCAVPTALRQRERASTQNSDKRRRERTAISHTLVSAIYILIHSKLLITRLNLSFLFELLNSLWSSFNV